jgi:nucleotide-binding universal stress UspA family protein
MQKILVPTDRSADSEKALAVAQQIAEAQNAEILLVRVFEPAAAALPAADGAIDPTLLAELTQSLEDELRADLSHLEERIRARTPRVRSLVLSGPVPIVLLDCEAQEKPDLVVMASHGRTGLARFAFGSITARLVREGSVPVLVTRRTSGEGTKLERVLLLLDGSGVAEEAIPAVKALAGKPVRSVTLYRVVANPDDRGAALNYLEGASAQFSSSGVEVTCKVDIGDPRKDVDRAAEDADLVVLCTHGRSGFDRLRHGSVAEHVMRQVDKPALLVRASQR